MAIERGRNSGRSVNNPNYRSSVRSYGSASSSGTPKQRVLECCRALAAFMCTQVGVGVIVVGYAVVGAFMFMYLETQEENIAYMEMELLRNETIARLWNVTDHLNVLSDEVWKSDVKDTLINFQERLVEARKVGYDGRTVEQIWTFPAALMFSLSVITMIGYGQLVPRTDWGKVTTMLYAVVGIPVYFMYFMNMGAVLASVFKWCYSRPSLCGGGGRDKMPYFDEEQNDSTENPNDNRDQNETSSSESSEGPVIVSSMTCVWVLVYYGIFGTVLFGELEGWNYLDAAYFCVTTLCKIGMGDFVPGAGMIDGEGQTKLVITFVYVLIGMALIAMCYSLTKEEVLLRLGECKLDCYEYWDDLKLKVCGRYASKKRGRSE